MDPAGTTDHEATRLWEGTLLIAHDRNGPMLIGGRFAQYHYDHVRSALDRSDEREATATIVAVLLDMLRAAAGRAAGEKPVIRENSTPAVVFWKTLLHEYGRGANGTRDHLLDGARTLLSAQRHADNEIQDSPAPG